MLRSARRRAAPMTHRMASDVRRSGRTSTGTWYVEPPTRRDFTSTAGLTLSMAVLNIFSASCLLRSSTAIMASYMIRSAVDFLPRIIMMLTNLATSRLPYFGSGSTSRRGAIARRMALCSSGLRRLGAVLRAALLAAGHAGGVERASDDVIADARQVLHAAAADHHDRVLLQVVTDTRDVRGDLLPVREPHAGHLAEGRVRLLGGRGVHADADAPLLGTRLHGGRLGLLAHRLTTVANELVNSRHRSPSPGTATKLSLYNRVTPCSQPVGSWGPRSGPQTPP